PETTWTLYIITKENKSTFLYSLIPLFLFGLIFSALFGCVITMLLKKPQQLRAQVRKQAEKILESETKFRTMFEQAAIGIANVDSTTGQFLQIHDVYCKTLGFNSAEMLQKTFSDITHPEDKDNDLENMEKLRQGEIKDFSIEKRLVTKSGEHRWVNLTV